MKRFIHISVPIEEDVDITVDMKDIIENIDDDDWEDIIKEHMPHIVENNVKVDFQGDKLHRHLCDIAKVSYHISQDDLLEELRTIINGPEW